MKQPHAFAALALFAGSLMAAAPSALAQDFFAGKTINITVGSTTGGSYDAYARLVARHYGRNIAGNPSVVIKNLPGAGGIKASIHVYSSAPKDGTELAAPINSVPLSVLLEPGKFPLKVEEFIWIGNPASPANVLAVWHETGVKTVEDAKKKEVTIGSTNPATTKEMFPLIANRLLGTKFRVINGYLGGAEINLAVERGEVQGHGANSWVSYQFQNTDWVRDNKIVPLFQVTFERDPVLPDVPTLMELAQSEEQKRIIFILTATEAIGRPLVAPPGVPAARAQQLRRAFDATMTDKAFLGDADKAGLEVGPTSGEKLQEMVKTMMASPPDIVEKYKTAVASGK